MEFKYKDGQAVRVRPDLESYSAYRMLSGPHSGRLVGSGPTLMSYRGKVVHVRHLSDGGWFYGVYEGPGALSDEMIVPVKPFVCQSLL